MTTRMTPDENARPGEGLWVYTRTAVWVGQELRVGLGPCRTPGDILPSPLRCGTSCASYVSWPLWETPVPWLGNTSSKQEQVQVGRSPLAMCVKESGTEMRKDNDIAFLEEERKQTVHSSSHHIYRKPQSPLAASWAHNRPVAQRARLRSRCFTFRPCDCPVVSPRTAHIFPGHCHHSGSTHPQPRGLSALPPSIPASRSEADGC